MERTPSDWSLNDRQDEVLYGIALEEEQAREVEGIREQLQSVTLEDTGEQVGHQGAVGPPPPPLSPQAYVRMAEAWVGREERQAERIRREVNDMEQMFLESGTPMSDFEKAMAEYHALDLREINYAVRNLIVEADTAVPALSPLLDASGPDDTEPPAMPQLNPNAPVFVSSVVPVYRVLRHLSLLLENQVQNQARLTGIGTFGSGPWYLRNADGPGDTLFGPDHLNLGPPLTPHVSNITPLPSTNRRIRHNRTARNRASRRRKKIRAQLARERAMEGLQVPMNPADMQ